jgi:hypothetical protein
MHGAYDIAYRIVAFAMFVSCSRKLWYGLVERKITSFNPDLLDWSRQVQNRDAEPVRYWIEIGITIFTLVACFIAVIIGWWQPNT